MEELKVWRIIGFVCTGFIIVVAFTLICVGVYVGIKKAFKFFRKRKNAEENSNNEEGNVVKTPTQPQLNST